MDGSHTFFNEQNEENGSLKDPHNVAVQLAKTPQSVGGSCSKPKTTTCTLDSKYIPQTPTSIPSSSDRYVIMMYYHFLLWVLPGINNNVGYLKQTHQNKLT